MMNTIDEQWGRFSSAIGLKDTTPVQQVETKRAFYAGAASMLHLQMRAADMNLSEAAAIAMLNGWHEECDAFGRAIVAGEA